MRFELVTPPAEEPVSVPQAIEHCHAEEGVEDGAFEGWIQSAREQAESDGNRALVTQTWRALLDAFPAGCEIEIPKRPLQSVESIQYRDEDGVLQTLDTDEYEVDTSGETGRILLAYDSTWPITRAQPNAVRIEFVAGYGDAADVPGRIKDWIKTRVASSWRIREGEVVGHIVNKVPHVDNLVRSDRIGF